YATTPTAPALPAVQLQQRVSPLARVVGRAAQQRTVDRDPRADAGAEVDHGHALRHPSDAEPHLRQRDRLQRVVDVHGHAEALLEELLDPDVVPVPVRREDRDAGVRADLAGHAHAGADDAVALGPARLARRLDRADDAVDDVRLPVLVLVERDLAVAERAQR